jgi:GMP synthase-like glutamine amidotransferase
VNPEREQIRRADQAGVPILGICFGGQMLAATFGGEVVASPSPEIGWTEVASDDEAIVPSGRWFQWHYDRWNRPPESREIARNAAASQAFVLRQNLAVQFHPELSGDMLAGWLANGGATKATSAGLDVAELVSATRLGEAEAHARAHRLVDGFLDVVVGDHPAATPSTARRPG